MSLSLMKTPILQQHTITFSAVTVTNVSVKQNKENYGHRVYD